MSQSETSACCDQNTAGSREIMANRKRNVSYVSQDEPAFLKQFKQRVGFKAEPGIDAKFAGTPDFDSDDDTPETEEERPQVVVLKKGDLSAEEVQNTPASDDKDGAGDDAADTGGRIIFKKPVKRSNEDKSDLQVSSSKKHKDSSKHKDKKHKSKDKQKNTKLLSFDDEEEED